VRIATEVAGSRVLDAPGGPFTLRARADRIDCSPAGLVITDYKTGAPPSNTAVLAGIAPQLPLEAAIARTGGFAGVEAAPVTGLRYIRATGGEPAGKEHLVRTGDADALGASCLAQLGEMVATYDSEALAYKAIRRAGFNYTYDDFAHLARVAEWSGGEDGDDERESSGVAE